jgi:type I restriction enzyme S subunit
MTKQLKLVEPIKEPYKLPATWKWVRLGSVCEKITAGGTPSRSKKEYWENGNIPWVKISDMKSEYVTNTEEFITEEGLKNSSAKIFPKGTILFTLFATLGRVSILSIDATTNQAIAGVFEKKDLVDKDFLFYYLTSIQHQWLNKSKGVTQENINQTILKNVLIPLPPLEEQKRIVASLEAALSRVNRAKEFLEESGKAIERIETSILTRAFRGDL